MEYKKIPHTFTKVLPNKFARTIVFRSENIQIGVADANIHHVRITLELRVSFNI